MSLMKKQTKVFKAEPDKAAGLESSAYVICRWMSAQTYLSGLSSAPDN